MSKMTVIQLLNKIANGEEVPKKIKVYEHIYTLDRDSLNYMCGENDWLAFIDGDELNTYEVEIIEEDKKIEPLMNCINAIRPNEMSSYYEKEKLEDIVKHNFDVIHKKINEIIDYLEEQEE